ncbi:13322_t:CDS:2 [Gigaspora margarita]|uniref:13322_t:CDS:1 n=1 Tax=Gigaspora margarita TaxID=4874 RepID=A0ABN7UHX4_GIGMA|nr:13322_t:CDS:2 [Gigaspora margarita]
MHHLSKLFVRPFLSRSSRQTSSSNVPDRHVPDNQVQVLDSQAPDSQVPNSQITIFEEIYKQELEYFLIEPPNQWSWYRFLKHLSNKGLLKDNDHANPLYPRCLERIVDNLTYTEEMRKFVKKNLSKKEMKFENVELSGDDGEPSTLNRAQSFSDDMNNSSNEARLSDDNAINSATIRELSNIRGIARYYIIFLPESNKKDLIRQEFSDEEWNVLEKAFSKKNDKISAEVIFPTNKVETILKEYDDSLKQATENYYVDLHAVAIIPSYQNHYKFHNDWLSKWSDLLSTFKADEESGEYQYRSWLDSSKHPDERNSIGWYHDGVLKININGTEMQAGFLEVIGNAIVEDYRKKIDDRNKVLKGVADEELKQKLETFGIIVDNTPTQLYLLKDIINILLKFRARVERLYNQIIALLSITSQQNMRPQRITVPVVASPAILKTHRSIILDDS